ncbi:MAG: DUF1788 domain-containing protein [Sphaerochaeta sp.]|jgi:hypothetical protein|nr:DUF1788 domain-containing protein [Sphaerochaeta sp.]
MSSKEMTYNERYAFLLDLLDDDKFIRKKYVGAEIPNYICAFPPEDVSSYNDMLENLAKALTSKGRKVLKVNVYEIMIEMLKDSGDFEDYLEEPSLTHKKIMEDFEGVLDNDTEFAPKVASIINESVPGIVLMNGIGEAYPFIRIHTLLEKLPTLLKRLVPIVVFYPGNYDKVTGSSALQLFGKLEHKNYYRAFNIFTEVR